MAPDCEQAFILGITDALQHDLSLANRDNAKSLMLLIKEFLTPGSRYEVNIFLCLLFMCVMSKALK